MKVLIIEDELLAQAKLETMLQSIDSSIQIVGKLASVKESITWLMKNVTPDVAFVDIQLSDDHSFEIFRKYPIHFPVVFTTAYDKYLLDSFEFNSIDYLLKPISADKLKRSLLKLKKLEQHFIQGNILKLMTQQPSPTSQKRIVVKKGAEFIALTLEDIAYFFTEHRIVFVKDFNGRQFIIDKNLSEIEADMDNKQFYRINRKFITNINAIEKFKSDNGKIRIFLKPEIKEDVHISKETAPDFRKWIGAD
jgi:DNA-binding LytR/AlgR family response regulator